MSFLRMAVFFLITIGIVCGLHYVLYAGLVRFGVVSHPGVKKAVFWLLMLLGVSFIPSAILMRTVPGVPANLLYIAASFWLGLFIYLLMASLLSWSIFGLSRMMAASLNMRMIMLTCCMAAVLVVVYGTLRARYPSLKSMDITIKGLPDEWCDKTIVQLSDVHLGAVQGPGFMQRVAKRVNSTRPDLILITGDLFDGVSSGNLSAFIDSLNQLKAARGIYFVTGNHEGYLGLNGPLSVLSKTDITILDNELVELDGLQIVGIPFPEHSQDNHVQNLLTDSGVYDSGKPAILMYHTPTNIGEKHTDRGDQQTNTYWRPDTGMALAKSAGIDLQLSGHSHRGQLFPFTLLTHFIFQGYDYGLHRDGDFQIYVTSGAGTWGPPMRIACPPEIPVIRLKSFVTGHWSLGTGHLSLDTG